MAAGKTFRLGLDKHLVQGRVEGGGFRRQEEEHRRDRSVQTMAPG